MAFAVSARRNHQREKHMDNVIVTVELSTERAWALAQLVKRISWNTCRRMAENGEQASLMIQATERVRRALAEVVYAPR